MVENVSIIYFSGYVKACPYSPLGKKVFFPWKTDACNGNQQQSLTEPFFISVLEHIKFKTFHS